MSNFKFRSKFIVLGLATVCFFGQNLRASSQTHKDFLLSLDKKISDSKFVKGSWYPSYHYSPKGSVLSEVAALGFFKEKYRLFTLQEIVDEGNTFKILAQSESEDLLHWKKLQPSIAQFNEYDKISISGGSSIADDELLYLFYTGVGFEPKPVDSQKNESDNSSKAAEKETIASTQNLAMSKDGFNFGKSANNPVIKAVTINNTHEFSSDNFSNPYIWKVDDEFYALVGAQYKKSKDGAVLLFKSKDLRNWSVVNVAAIGQKGEMGYMWESPAMFNLNGHDVLSISPKGIKPHGKMFLNKNQSGAFVGKLDYKTGKFVQKGAFMLYDYGFDFYAPKFIKTPDGRVICIALMGMDGTQRLEKDEMWSGIATIPREIKIVNGKLHTIPAKEVESLRGDKISIHPVTFNGEKEFAGVHGTEYELYLTADLSNTNNFSVILRTGLSNQTVLSYDKNTKILKLNRDKSGLALSGEREVVLPLYENKLHLRIFVDKSSVEIFANNGAVAMSSRIYPEKNSNGIKFVSDGEAKIEELNFYKLKHIEN